PAAQPSAHRMDGASGGLGSGDNALTTEALFVRWVGHETRPPTTGTNVLGRKVLYLARQARCELTSSALSTVTQGSRKKVPDEIQQVSNKDDMKTSLKKVVKETSYTIMMPWVVVHAGPPPASHLSARHGPVCGMGGQVQRRVDLRWEDFQRRGPAGILYGLNPPTSWEIFLWGCNLLAHFINACLVDDSVLTIRANTKFVMGIAMSLLTSSFLLVVFKSWTHRWKNLSMQGQLFQGSRPPFRRVSSGVWFALE
ncbi:hypothetical protein Celaphus_00014852, partial [Cervus elaphus hippelaphus]